MAAALFIALFFLIVYTLSRYSTMADTNSQENGFVLMMRIGFGIFYVGFSFSHFTLLMTLPTGRNWLMLLTAITVFSDSAAYFTGRKWGRHKLAPAISPGKSVEGLLGGLFGAVIAAVIVSLLMFPGVSVLKMVDSDHLPEPGRGDGRPDRIGDQADHGGQGFRQHPARPRRGSGPPRLPDDRHPGPLLHDPFRLSFLLRSRAANVMAKTIALLGSTGSIGRNVLEVVRRYPDRFRVAGLAAGNNLALLKEQIEEFSPELVSVADPAGAEQLRQSLAPDWRERIVAGPTGIEQVATMAGVEQVVSAVVGAAGLLPTLAAIRAGKHIALANKETLVMAGELIMAEAARCGVTLHPVDSEHSAIAQALDGRPARGCQPPGAHRLGRPLLHAAGEKPGRGHPGRGPGPSQLEHGQEDLHRLRHPDEQGAGGHRGAPPLPDPGGEDRGADPSRSPSSIPWWSIATGR